VHWFEVLGRLNSQLVDDFLGAITERFPVDTRRTHRFPVEESIAAIWMDNGRTRRVIGQTRDISESGVFFYVITEPVEGSRVEVVLEFPRNVTGKQSSPVSCRGRVVRVELQAHKFGVAIEIDSCADLAPTE
jgi:hypothetical protein